MSGDKKAFWEAKNTDFLEATDDCDYLHPETRTQEPSPELTETQYLGFNIPEHNIHSLNYMWQHPNLGVVTGGAWAWQGVKSSSLQSEIFDMLIYVSDDCLGGDLHDFQLPNSYRVRVHKPLHHLQLEYSDPERGNAIDVEYRAMMKPMVMSTGAHFEQGMKTSGVVTLRGKEFEVDGYTVRDRSWGHARSEQHVNAPPMGWLTCVFNDDFAFSTTAFDSEDTDPEWKGIMTIPGADPVRGGWIYRDGQLTPVVKASKRTWRNEQTLFPERVQMTIADINGDSLDITGTVVAASNWRTWHNFETVICQVRWECNGLVGHGDHQEFLFTDYVRRFMGDLTGGASKPRSLRG